jgi:hypothetical protein
MGIFFFGLVQTPHHFLQFVPVDIPRQAYHSQNDTVNDWEKDTNQLKLPNHQVGDIIPYSTI